MQETNIIIDGRFVEQERDLTLAYRGSRNQKIWFNDKTATEYIYKLFQQHVPLIDRNEKEEIIGVYRRDSHLTYENICDIIDIEGEI